MIASTIVGTRLDYFIIIAYFVVIFGFGSLFARFTRSTRDFFFGGQRFAWWLIGFSCIATTVGSYSFIKYAAAGFRYGFSSSMSYFNDWIIAPLFLLTWLPIIYYSKVTSVPEYFERRFDRKNRMMATLIILVYMIGYVGINLYTMGVAMNAILGTDIFWSAVIIAVVCGFYVMAGGQTAVIMTDLLQGILLLFAGFLLFFIGLARLGGWDSFWSLLPVDWRLPLAKFNKPHAFHFSGIFWQDGVANNIFVYFLNQGMILRFLSLKSVKEAKKTFLFYLIFLMPLGAVAVANAGWLGKAFVEAGILPASTDPNRIFVDVAALLCGPGVFGIILAALCAALMSTIDTLINAISVVAVHDIYRPYIAKEKTDRHYLKVARIISLTVAFIGILLVPLFSSFKSIYVAHGAFTASVTPPMAVAVLMGILWKRYTSAASFWTMLGGSIAIGLSVAYPILIQPFGHGVDPAGGFKYLRAFYGIAVSMVIGLVVTRLTKPKPLEMIKGYVLGTVQYAKERYKGGKPNEAEGKPVEGRLTIVDGEKLLSLSPAMMETLKARTGDLAYVADGRRLLGGLRSVHARLGAPHQEDSRTIRISRDLVEEGDLLEKNFHYVEKIF